MRGRAAGAMALSGAYIHRSRRASDRVQRPGGREPRHDARGIADIDTEISGLRPGRDDLMSRAEFADDGAAEHAAGADDEYAQSRRV